VSSPPLPSPTPSPAFTCVLPSPNTPAFEERHGKHAIKKRKMEDEHSSFETSQKETDR
jgi:hypothetical protein